jgi:ABC-type branched-subunit amino acid transport system ATPase component
MIFFFKLLKLLTLREKKKLIYIFILLFINSAVELISIGSLLPLLTILLNEKFIFFGMDFSHYNQNITYINLLIRVSIIVGLAFLIKNLFIFYFFTEQSRYARDVQYRLSSNLFYNYLSQKYLFFANTNSAFLIRNMSSTATLSIGLSSYVILISEILICILMIVYLCFLNFLPTLLSIIFFLLLFLLIYRSSRKKISTLGQLNLNYSGLINKQYIHAFGLIKTIKIFNLEKVMSNFFNKLFFNSLYASYKLDLILQIPKLLVETIIIIFICGIMIIMTVQGKTSTEILLIILVYAAVGLRFIPSTTRIISAAQRIKTYTPAIINLFDEFIKTSFVTKTNKENIIISSASEIRLENISHQFKDSQPILKDINMRINKNQPIGIYGDSGSGKSTLVNILSGLIIPSKGKIYIDDNYFDYKKNICLKIGYVPQDTQIFDDTIWNNVTFFQEKNKNNLDLFLDAVKKVNLYEYIYSPNNFLKEDLLVGERGSKISGGQAQRIGIARALFLGSNILIFDEVTSSLDRQNEKEIIKTIYSLKKDKIIIIISHNKDNLYSCDQIFEIKDMSILTKIIK